jgi:hypothetical protein
LPETDQDLLTEQLPPTIGMQIFLCGGRLMFGPDAPSLLLTTFLIVAPTIIFCYQKKSRFYGSGEQQQLHQAAALVVTITTIMVSVSLSHLCQLHRLLLATILNSTMVSA